MVKEGTDPPDADGSSHEILSTKSSIANEARDPAPNDSGETTKASGTSAGDEELDPKSNIPSRSAVSQPMTASTSSSSTPSLKDAAAGAAPYGTRSRNRGGASRPNYAEDREIETEFDMQSVAKEEDSRKSTRASDTRSSIGVETGSSANSARRAPGTQIDYDTIGLSVAKDHIPGTSTFSANPTAPITSQPSKKRKAAGQSTPSTTYTSTPVNGALPGSHHSTRRASLAAQSGIGFRESNMLSFETCAGRLKDGKLIADDGTILRVNDHAYLVCEPPGEPYYLGRIMEFLHVGNDSSKPIDALRINWYYRPKDIGRKVNDTRQVFASMHSDISPLTALRGLCQIRHKSEVQNLDEFRRTQNCFWYEKLFDRYIHRYYEVIPTSQVVNVPANVKRVLDDRWKFILVESGRGKELTSAVKSCKRCSGYCANNDSVDCAVCHQTYHMNCVRPPLLKKPSRGFAWACGPCSRAQERKLEARNTPNLADAGVDADDEEMIDEDDDEALDLGDGDGADTGRTSPEHSSDPDTSVHPGTAEQIHQASLWPFRYLGVHCKVEDALDYDDRIYPRASSRLGPRHQANVTIWHGRPVELIKPADIKRKYVKGSSHKKDAKLSKETVAALEADKVAREKRPKWVMDEPQGYVRRGEDHENGDPSSTAELLFKSPEVADDSSSASTQTDQLIDDYMLRAMELAKVVGVPKYSVNFLDKALNIFHSRNYDAEVALKELSAVSRKDLKEPELTVAEVKKFEDGIAKFGSELHSVKRHVKTVSPANIVRFYYAWKKTDRGRQVWGNFAGRKGKKEAKKAEVHAGKLQDDVADDHDDSAFDNDKAVEKKRQFQCKFCSTRTSRQWRRAPNTAAGTMILADPSSKAVGKDKGAQLMVALCLNCAVVWRKYAVQWEDGDDHGKKAAQNGGRTNKRKVDDSHREFQLNEMNWTASNTDTATSPTSGTPVPQISDPTSVPEPARKKARGGTEKDPIDPAAIETGGANTAGQQKKKAVERPGPPPVPELPKPKILPCAVCLQMEPMGDQHLACKECRMTVHRNCYGVIGETRGPNKWVCDMCANDKNPQVSINYECVLCPHTYTEQDFVEPPKISHKKKTEKEREKDRIEREIALKSADFYKRKQEEMNRPVNPREPLKRTANNNWVHVTCAVWTPEVKFAKAKALELCEGIPSIPTARYDDVCKVCKTGEGACVSCHTCRTPVHVECAHQSGYVLGFDIAPVKGSRRDQFSIVSINGEAGIMTAAVWCKDHHPTKTIVHRMHDVVDDTGLNALQLYVQNFKEADLTLTGTVRKATLVNQSTKLQSPTPIVAAPNRRASTATISGASARGSISNVKVEEGPASLELVSRHKPVSDTSGICVTCKVELSPKWWPYHALHSKVPASTERVLVAIEDPSPRVNGDSREQENGQFLTNGHAHQNSIEGTPKPALAVLENGFDFISDEVQCHKCHHKKIRKHSPSPLQSVPPPKLDTVRVQPSTPAPTAPTPGLNSPQPVHASSHYSWPHQAAYSPGPYNDWPRPSPGSSQPHNLVHPYSGSRSPRGNTVNHQQVSSQSQIRQTVVTMPHSPRVNGPLGSQISNGYPVSPHQAINSTHQMQNGAYGSYASTRPPPHHLINGGPPPRAPESPFSHHTHGTSHHHASFGSSHASPPVNREPPPLNREHHSQSQSMRSSDGRVNGGASASPSLHNLLS